MKTLNIHDRVMSGHHPWVVKPNEISSLVEQFIDTDERPIQIITNYEAMTGKTRKVVGEILSRKRKQGEMKYYCLFNTPYITWRIYK